MNQRALANSRQSPGPRAPRSVQPGTKGSGAVPCLDPGVGDWPCAPQRVGAGFRRDDGWAALAAEGAEGCALSRIFLSHSSLDNRQALALRQWLIDQDPSLRGEIFLDLHPEAGIHAGQQWMDALRAAGQRCEAVVCLVSEHWEASSFCNTEYYLAELLSKKIFSARIDQLSDTDPTRSWQQVDLFGDGPAIGVELADGGEPVVFQADGLQRLRNGIHRAGIGAQSFPWPPDKDPDRAPYRGWEPLDEADAAVFFGRDGQISAGMDALRRMRETGDTLFVVLGQSGTGKSSFLRAGLLPRLRRDDHDFVVVEIVRPQNDVLTGPTGLANAIHATRSRAGLNDPVLADIEQACLRGDAAQVRAWLRQLQETARGRLLEQAEDAPPPTVVIPVDQAEELFGPDVGSEASRFLQLIADLRDTGPNSQPWRFIVAFTIRADGYQNLHGAEPLQDVGSVAFTALKAMPSTLFKDVVTKPADRADQAGRRLVVENALVERLLDDCTEGADTLPLLALTLALLYAKYRRVDPNAKGVVGQGIPGFRLAIADYEAMGGIRRVVQSEIDGLLDHDAEKRAAELAVLRRAFLLLASVNPLNNQPMRRIARWDDLPPESHPLLDRFVERRLVVKDRRGGEIVVEVALESLLRQWDQAAGWLAEESEDLKQADDLERTNTAWTSSGQDDAWLLHGTRLADAVRLLERPGFGDRLRAATALVEASQQREDERAEADRVERERRLREAEEHAADLQRRSRVLRRVLAGTAVVAILALVGAFVAWDFYRKADVSFRQADVSFRQATAQRLDSEAAAIMEGKQPGTDVQAFTELLVANKIQQQLAGDHQGPPPSAGPSLDALVSRMATEKLIDVGGPVVGSALTPTGDQIAVVVGGDVRIWSVDKGAPIGNPLPRDGGVSYSGVAFDPSGRWLAASSAGPNSGSIRLFDAATHAVVRTFDGPPNQDSLHVTFSSDGHRIAAGYADGTAWVWNVDTGARELVLPTGSGKAVNSVAFSAPGHPERSLIATGGEGGMVRIWDAMDGAPLGAVDSELGQVTDLAFDPTGALAAAGGAGHGVQLFYPADGPGMVTAFTNNSPVWAIAWNPHFAELAVGDDGGTVKRWYFPTVDEPNAIPSNLPLPGQLGVVFDVTYNDDGSRVAAGGVDGIVTIWKPRADKVTVQRSLVVGVAFSRDGSRVAAAEHDGTVQLWDPTSTTNVGPPLVGDSSKATGVAFDPAADLLAVGRDDGTVSLWGPDFAAPPRTLPGSNPVGGVAFSRDGKLLAAASGSAVELWQPDSGAPARQSLTVPGDDPKGDTINAVAFSPTTHLIAAGSRDKKIYVWDADSGGLRKTITTPSAVTAVVFSPDGRYIVSGGGDNSVQMWDAATGDSTLGPLAGHTAAVTALAYTKDGKFFISSGSDGRIIFWDSTSGAPTGNPLSEPPANSMEGNTVTGIAMSPDGKYLAAGSLDKNLRLWPGSPDPSELCARLNVNPSQAQWDQWIGHGIDYVKDLCTGLPRSDEKR